MRDRLLASMRTIAAQPRGFFSGGAPMHLDTGAFDKAPTDRIELSHLTAVFGLPEVCAELNQLLDVPEFRQAWLDYCELYSAPAEEQTKRLGAPLKGNALTQGHARLTAYAARLTSDPALGRRAWKELLKGPQDFEHTGKREPKHLKGPAVLRPVDEAAYVSSNDTAQWGLSAMECLALAGDELPDS
jgi:hypothetical protein